MNVSLTSAMARPQIVSIAVSMVSQSYSEISSRAPKSSSRPKSHWQGWVLVMMEMRIDVTSLIVSGGETKEGPEALRVAARERLVSVTRVLEVENVSSDVR